MSAADDKLDQALRGTGGAELRGPALDALGTAARAELAAHPKPRPWWVDGLGLLAVNALLGGAASMMMAWSTSQSSSELGRNLTALAWLLVMTAGSVLWLRPGRLLVRGAVVLGFALVAGASLLGASGVTPDAPFLAGARCAMAECLIAVIPVAVMLAFSTRFAASAAHVFTGALAVGSGAALALHLHCGNGGVPHLLVFHLLPVVALAGLAVLVRRVLPSRTWAP